MVESWLQRNQNRLTNVLLSLVIFGAGWHTGRIMSPYYDSQEIIINNAQPNIQGVQNTVKTEVGEGNFVSSVNSNLFHHVSCAAAKRINDDNKEFFATAGEAVAAGLTPSQCAKEKMVE